MRGGWVVALLGCLALAGTAAAAPKKAEKRDFAVVARGGVGDYTGDLGELIEAGVAWGLTVNLQPYTFLGWELNYDGARNGLQDDRVEDGSVNRHGASGLLKVSLPFIERIRPYLAAGLGASYVTVTEDAGDLYGSDLIAEVPVGLGLEFNTGAFTTGLRTTFRPFFGESFADSAAEGSGEGGFFDAHLALGARF